MVSEIERHAQDCSSYTHLPIFSREVMNAMMQIPRHRFVPETHWEHAYDDSPLSIGYGQTISQPFIVALMCEALKLGKNDCVLEIGSGCGYHAAVLSMLCKEVYTVEVIESLAILAEKNLKSYQNVKVINKNGYDGYKPRAPFDAISIAASIDVVPESLIEQLKPQGRMIIPLESQLQFGQSLTVIKRRKNGSIYRTDLLPVIFVPFVKK